MQTLEMLDLEGNKVDDMGALQYLSWCPQLVVLTLADNPVAADVAYQAQVCKVLPKLQTLDDTKLVRPVSLVSKPAPVSAELQSDDLYLSPTSSPWSSADTDGKLNPATALSSPGQNLSSDAVGLSRVQIRQNRLLRPASAGRLPQRLPPVAAGHNQPGTYLLYSLSQQPSDVVLSPVSERQHFDWPKPLFKQASEPVVSSADILLHSSRVYDGHMALCSDSNADDGELVSDVKAATAGSVKVARPFSAGIKRAESRLGSPIPVETTSRPSSAGAGAARSGSAEAAGLYWRKHRLMVPAGYAMTEAEAQTAATASAQQYHVCDSQAPAVQAVESAAAQEAGAEAVSNLNSPGCTGQAEVSSSSACDILVIEDAAELTHDRAAAILRQLSYECQAAGPHCATSLYANPGATLPLQSPCQAAAASVSAVTSAVADHHSQAQTVPTPYYAAGLPASQQLPHLAAVAWPQHIISKEALAVADGYHQQGQSQQSAAQAAMGSAPATESPFLQRLQMSKQAGSTTPSSAVVQPSSMPGPFAPQRPSALSARPPSPERPPTPSFKPARRRHIITAATEDVPSPAVSTSWAGSNRQFAPMQQQLSWDPAQSLLAVRPASAGVAESQTRHLCSEMSWTGSMQLPAGLLKLTARPQQHNAGRKGKHQYDWGFCNSRGVI
ncbi:TPA: Leucine-rich repeat-containing protein 56 [Trebouxia sp. C0004]